MSDVSECRNDSNAEVENVWFLIFPQVLISLTRYHEINSLSLRELAYIYYQVTEIYNNGMKAIAIYLFFVCFTAIHRADWSVIGQRLSRVLYCFLEYWWRSNTFRKTLGWKLSETKGTGKYLNFNHIRVYLYIHHTISKIYGWNICLCLS